MTFGEFLIKTNFGPATKLRLVTSLKLGFITLAVVLTIWPFAPVRPVFTLAFAVVIGFFMLTTGIALIRKYIMYVRTLKKLTRELF